LAHTAAFPDIFPGCNGTDEMLTDKMREGLLPQLFVAVKEIEPEELPAVVVIAFIEEDPNQPDGKVQL
jgi:hypothetical protein